MMPDDDQDQDFPGSSSTRGESPCSPRVGFFCPAPPVPPTATHDEMGRPYELPDLLRPAPEPAPTTSLAVRQPIDLRVEIDRMHERRRNPAAQQSWRDKVDEVLRSSAFWIGLGVGGIAIALLVGIMSAPSRRSTDF